MKTLFRFAVTAMLAVTLAAALLAPAAAGEKEKDIFDYDAQKNAPKERQEDRLRRRHRRRTAPRGNHEFLAGAIYLARTHQRHTIPTPTPSSTRKDKWPKDLTHADAVIVLLNHGGSAVNPAVKEAIERGAGFMAIHYGVEVNKGEQGEHLPEVDGRLLRDVLVGQPVLDAEVQEDPRARDHARRQAVQRQRRVVLSHALRRRT